MKIGQNYAKLKFSFYNPLLMRILEATLKGTVPSPWRKNYFSTTSIILSPFKISWAFWSLSNSEPFPFSNGHS